MKRRKANDNQISIFDLLVEQKQKQQPGIIPGKCGIDAKLRQAIFDDLKNAKDENGRELSRYHVAARMSELLHEDVTYNQLCNWVSESHGDHNMPAKYISALTIATGNHNTQDVIARGADGFYLPGEEALMAEIGRFREKEQEVRRERKRRETLLREVRK